MEASVCDGKRYVRIHASIPCNYRERDKKLKLMSHYVAHEICGLLRIAKQRLPLEIQIACHPCTLALDMLI